MVSRKLSIVCGRLLFNKAAPSTYQALQGCGQRTKMTAGATPHRETVALAARGAGWPPGPTHPTVAEQGQSTTPSRDNRERSVAIQKCCRRQGRRAMAIPRRPGRPGSSPWIISGAFQQCFALLEPSAPSATPLCVSRLSVGVVVGCGCSVQMGCPGPDGRPAQDADSWTVSQWGFNARRHHGPAVRFSDRLMSCRGLCAGPAQARRQSGPPRRKLHEAQAP